MRELFKANHKSNQSNNSLRSSDSITHSFDKKMVTMNELIQLSIENEKKSKLGIENISLSCDI
jgi:hypothetical protein